MKQQRKKINLEEKLLDGSIKWLAPRATYKSKNGNIVHCCVLMMDRFDAMVAPLVLGPSIDWVPRRLLKKF